MLEEIGFTDVRIGPPVELPAEIGPLRMDAECVTVNADTLDHICDLAGLRDISLVKIDVEGFELPVLQGAERVLQTAELLFLEVHPEAADQLRLSPPLIFDFLRSRCWRGYTLKEEAPLAREDFAAQKDIFRTMWRKR